MLRKRSFADRLPIGLAEQQEWVTVPLPTNINSRYWTGSRLHPEHLPQEVVRPQYSAASLNQSGLRVVTLRRKALLMTETELRLMASAAIIGDSNQPVNGNNTPAASGTPSML